MTRNHRWPAQILGFLAALFLIFPGLTDAQSAPPNEPPRVVAVRVITESGTALAENPREITIQSGQPFTLEAEAAALRELYRTGKYADLRAELTDVPGGVRLDFVVRQNLYINRVQITGLKEPPSDSAALAALRLNLGEAFTEAGMKEAVARLQQTLADEGLYQAKIGYDLMQHSDTLQMDILVRVTPGIRARLGELTIENMTDFPDADLRDHLKLKPQTEITSDRLTRASDRARKWLAKGDYLGARVTLNRGAYNSSTNRVAIEGTFYAGLQVRVNVEGAKVPSRTLHGLLPIFEEGSVDEDLLQEGRRALRDWFERAGYFDAQVDYTTKDIPPEEAGGRKRAAAELVTYQVSPGEHRRLAGVGFSGNKYFSSDLLEGRLQIAPAGYASSGRYSATMLDDDVNSIRNLYLANGFQIVAVQSKVTDNFRGRPDDRFVTFEISEGPQTRVADLSIDGNKELGTDELMAIVGSTKGQPYSDFNVTSDRDNILALYYEQGFADAHFTADAVPVSGAPADAPRVQVAYHITEGQQVRVARVLLDGYEHTRAGVISREVGIHAGDPLSEAALVDTQRKLYNLGVFSRVSIAPQNPAGIEPEKTMVVMVDEARRYTLAYGLGAEAQRLGGAGSSAVSGTFTISPRVTLELAKANLTGRADTLSFKVRASTIQGRALVAYTAPNYFGDPNLSLQVSGFFDKTRDVQTFSSRRWEGTVQFTDQISRANSMFYRYAYRHITATDLNIEPEEIPLFSQPTEVSEVGTSWLHDQRNNPADASRGNYEDVDVDLAVKAFGSSASFLRILLQNSTYHPIGRRLVFARSIRFGVQTPYQNTLSEDIPLPERFFAGGGTTLRGFGLNQAGPRDPVTGFPVGGQALFVLNQELRFPMHLPWIGNRLGGAVFYDGGNVYPTVEKISLRTAPPMPTFNGSGVCLTNCTNELNYFSHTVGFAFRYSTPIGPVSVDLAYQLNPAYFSGPVTLPNNTPGMGLTKLPGFQFFINLGSTF
jgi:outer membrane protein insertion porin family